MVADQIEREITIAAPIDRVWSILTEAEHIAGWFTDAGAEIDELRPGGALTMSWAEHGTHTARIVTVEPPRRFAYRWGAHHHEPGDELVEGNSTLVEFTLRPEADSTRLKVLETGFSSLAVTDEQRALNHKDNTGGWEEMTRRAAEYAERVAA